MFLLPLRFLCPGVYGRHYNTYLTLSCRQRKKNLAKKSRKWRSHDPPPTHRIAIFGRTTLLPVIKIDRCHCRHRCHHCCHCQLRRCHHRQLCCLLRRRHRRFCCCRPSLLSPVTPSSSSSTLLPRCHCRCRRSRRAIIAVFVIVVIVVVVDIIITRHHRHHCRIPSRHCPSRCRHCHRRRRHHHQADSIFTLRL